MIQFKTCTHSMHDSSVNGPYIAVHKRRALHAAMDIQQLARKREERLGMMEYELRVAKEDMAEFQVHQLLLQCIAASFSKTSLSPNCSQLSMSRWFVCRHHLGMAALLMSQLPQAALATLWRYKTHCQMLLGMLQYLKALPMATLLRKALSQCGK